MTSGRLALAVLTLSLAVAPTAEGQDAVLRTRERAAMLTEFRALLEHTDPATRMAAFEEAMAGKDQVLKTMAMDAAMGSSDDNLKTAALRVFLNGRATLSINVILPDRASDGLQLEYARWNALTLVEITVKDNVIGGSSNAKETFRGGQMIPGGFSLNFSSYTSTSRCALTVRVAAAKQLAGNLDCSHPTDIAERVGARRTVFPVRIDLP